MFKVECLKLILYDLSKEISPKIRINIPCKNNLFQELDILKTLTLIFCIPFL